MSLGLGLGYIGGGARGFDSPGVYLPTGLGFDTTNFPIAAAINDPGGNAAAVGYAGITPEAMFDLFSTARSAPTNTYYVGAGGSDANPGTIGSKKLSIDNCIATGNTAAAPFKIIPDSMEYVRNLGFAGRSPTQDMAIVPAGGGRAVTGIFDAFATMTLDDAPTSTYKLTIGGVDRVLNRLVTNIYGSLRDHTIYSTAALLKAATITNDSYAYDTGVLYIRRLDLAIPTPTNTRVMRTSVKNFSITAEVNIYIENMDLEGGQIGALEYIRSIASTNRKVIVAKNCTFKYGGGNVNTSGRSLSVDGIKGLAYMYACTANAGQTDGFNYHDAQGNGTQFLNVNCIGNDNGRGTNASCNGLTDHETCTGIDLAGQYLGNHGGAVRNANAGKTLCAGTMAEDDGDLSTSYNACFATDNTSQIWCDRTKAIADATKVAYLASSGTSIHKRNVAATDGTSGGTGTIDTY